MNQQHTMLKTMIGEFAGCFFLGLVGLGSILQVIVYGGGTTAEIGILFGACIGLAVIIAAPVSGAVLNPAITIAQAAFKRLPWKNVLPFIGAQVAGWFSGTALLVAMNDKAIAMWEATQDIVRGTPSDIYSSQIFQCNMPNMLLAKAFGQGLTDTTEFMPIWACIVMEIICSALLCFFVLIFLNPKNRFAPNLRSFPMYLGIVVAVGIGCLLVGSSCCMNPARDLGPRLALACFGWDSAFPGNGMSAGGNWWIWWIVCTIGALLGEALYELINRSVTDDATLDAQAE